MPTTASAYASIKPTDLPVPPENALRVVRACSNPKVSSRDLNRLVGTDAVLTAEILRMVNSAYFGAAQRVRNVAHAITIIGQRALRNLVLAVAVREALRNSAIPGLDIASYTDDALLRAVAARSLGERLGLDADTCFTLGLLQDFGLLAMFHADPSLVSHWDLLRGLTPELRSQREMTLFGTTHEHVGRVIARAWSLPADLEEAIADHHASGEPGGPVTLRAVGRAADWLVSVFRAEDTEAALKGCQRELEELLHLDAEGTEALLRAVAVAVSEAAQGLGMRVTRQPDVDVVMRAANLRLAEENLSYQELTWRLENTLRERDELAARLRGELALAREIQKALLPREDGNELPIHGYNLPAGDVSGDFYDYFMREDGRIYFNVADVSGKGMNAALIMVKASSLFRSLARDLSSPARLLRAVNTELSETSVRGMFVTMVGGVYNPSDGSLRLANAGHPPPLYLRADGHPEPLPATAPPLGIGPDVEVDEVELRMDGGSLYLYTDGITESDSHGKGVPDIPRLLRTFTRLARLPPAQRLRTALDALQPDTSRLRDDVTLVVLEDPPRTARGSA